MVRGVKNGKCRTCVHASATAATVCNTHHCLCCAGASVVRSLPSCPRKIFRGIQELQVFRLVPIPAILPMSLSRLTVDINAVGMFTGHTATGLPGIRTRFPFQQRVRLSPNPPQNYSFAPKQKNKLRKFFRYSRRNFSSRFSRSTRRSRSSQTNAKNEGVSRHWLTPSLEYYK